MRVSDVLCQKLGYDRRLIMPLEISYAMFVIQEKPSMLRVQGVTLNLTIKRKCMGRMNLLIQ